MTIVKVVDHIHKTVRTNSPAILVATGITGTIATAYLSAKASFTAAEIIRVEEEAGGTAEDARARFKERAGFVWKLYIPAGISGVATIICIVSATRIESRRTAAALTAYSLSERALTEYRDKVVEVFGENKERSIRDKIAEDRIAANPPQATVIVSGVGNVLCCELLTGRYFSSDMETLRKAQNDINAKLLCHDYATLDDLYYMIGLDRTTKSNDIGWSAERQMRMEFTSVLAPDGRPCLAFAYNYTHPV